MPMRPPGSPRGPRGKDDAQIREQVEELVKTAGIPRNLAFQVARRDVSLKEVLERLSNRDRVDSLMRRHDLTRSLATQVANRQVSLDEILRKRRLEAHREANKDRSVFSEAEKSGAPLALAVHGLLILRGRVVGVSPYDLELEVDGQRQTVRKLVVKFAYDPATYSTAKRAMGFDSDKKAVCEPIKLPQDRYGCSDRRLFHYLDASIPLQVTLLEGNTLRGTVTWLSRWEFGLKLAKGGASAVVMRHALLDIVEEK